ncbi:DEAD/DEAH box helicase [Hydrogenothermus marinus]|uniref:DEAD/DEAH box helicase n=1 Tax=Hydrogenothermus marinus TaxID=133270 RepID=UPI001FEAD4FE|nr:DEAD/DEAH box helicase [Hydrogenothermus marinus]
MTNLQISNSSYLEYKLAKDFNKALIFIDSEKRALEIEKNLNAFLNYFNKNIPVLYIPSNTEIHDTLAQFKRNYAIYLSKKNKDSFFILTKESENIKVAKNKDFIHLKEGKEINFDNLVKRLIEFGYIKEEKVENEGEFSFKGGILRINIPFIGVFDIDFFGDQIEGIYQISKLLTKKKIQNIDIFPLYDFPVYYNEFFDLDFKKEEATNFLEFFKDFKIIEENNFVIDEEAISNSHIKGFEVVKLPITKPLFLKIERKSFIPKDYKSKTEIDIKPLEEGDYIIHEDYGIGIFRGIETKTIRGKDYDFMVLEYADGEKINVSYLHFDKIHKYDLNIPIKLDKIGGTSWRNLKKKVRKSVEKIAKELIKLYKERESTTRKPYNFDKELLRYIQETFPFLETPDQLKAIKDIENDFKSDKPTERLICGDVGFGKTEVAIRAAYISATNNRQTLILVPTTVLALQHYKKFKERLEPLGIKVENLSRLKSKKETEKILTELQEGKIDILVGTHKVLSDKVKFKNLGLLIIDEEHRFGVRAKEKIKQIKKDIDTIYLTATPIPRTLNMALSGLKKMSVINTPPEGRVETKTYVVKYNEDIIKQAIQREINRNGQVFYLHNRVETIEEKTNQLKQLFPNLKIDFIHGKMKPSQIEKKIMEFTDKKLNILVSTSIIETGIDIPTANTLIIERADLFGLAQLYHLRGRVGRGNIQAYCYLLLPEDRNITENAEKRLSTILKLTRPGSGLKVAIEDMKIRGAGNILGVEQSGNIKAVGFDFYVKLLKESIEKEQGKAFETKIETDIEGYIPKTFIENPQERMNIYLSFSKALDSEEIEELEEYLSEFYKDIPSALKVYISLEKIKKEATNLGIEKISIKNKYCEINFGKLSPEKTVKLIEKTKPEYITSNSIKFRYKNLEHIYKILKMIK